MVDKVRLSPLQAGAVFLLGLSLLQTTNCQTYLICDGEAAESDPDIDPRTTPSCYKLGDFPRPRANARAYCRRHGGTLSGDLFRYRDFLTAQGVTELWSSYYIRNNRLVEETAASPQVVDLSIASMFNLTEPFSVPEESCVRYVDCRSTSSQPSDLPCPDSGYILQFGACEEELPFLCRIPSRLLRDLELQRGDSDYFNINNQLDYNLQLSRESSSLANADDTCSRESAGGQAFRLSNPADDAVLQVLANQIRQYLGVIDVSERALSSTLFWVDSTNRRGCYTLAMIEQDDAFMPTVIQSWPCNAKLRVICQWNRPYEDQTEPVMEADIKSNLIRQIGNDVLAHSEVFQRVGGLVSFPTGTDTDLSGDSDPTGQVDSRSLRIYCAVPFLSTRQSATIYRNGQVFSRQEGQEFYEVRELQYDISLRQDPTISTIETVASYSCDYNQAGSTRLLTSNFLFVRPTDYEIFSAHFSLDRQKSFIPWSQALFSSLTDTWPGQGGSGPIRPQRQSASLEEFLSSLSGLSGRLGYQLLPLELRDLGLDTEADLVTYMYRQRSGISSQRFIDIDNTNESLTQAQVAAAEVLPMLLDFGVTQIEVISIDWCWATSRSDDVTNNVYELPTSRAPTVWKSEQICARDNAPLVTIECRGDKLRGYEWGPTRVNPLCDYSDEGSGEESSITDTLQQLAQDPINTDNVNTTVEELETLIATADPKQVTPVDVNLVADILQKVTTTGGVLDQETVEDILSTVDTVSRLPEDVLLEGQSIGQSSNRILTAADRVGSLIELSAQDNWQRVVSEGLGLEVWQLQEKTPDSNIIVGIKMLSDGSEEMVTYSELVSQFSDTQVEYDGTDAAIYLPEEFLRQYLNSANGTEVRLVMNVYKVTNLYRDPSMSEKDGVNRTLNSKVIAAQLLVNGVSMTDLGGYKVLTVFNPTRYVLSTEERPNRTMCVFWDFSANRNAGGWSSDGCQYGRTRDGRDVCECDHLTNFAVLVSFYDQSELEHKEVLGYITIVGLSLSIAGLALTMLSFICIKKLRKGRPQQTLFQLSLALLLSWIVFLAGIERTSNHDGCIAVAVLLHYLILVSFMWMLMEGLLQYLMFVRVMNSYFTHYMWKTSIPSWGLPIIPVIIILAIDTELYKGGDDYCWMDQDAFYYGFAIPVGLIILTNLVVFVLVTVSLCRRKDMSKHSSQQTNQMVVNIRASFICFCVLGLSWIFGFLAIEDARLVFQYLFCITASLQGFIVFLMMTARDKQVRQYWMQHLCCCLKGAGQGQSSTSTSSNSKTGSKDAMHIPRVHSTKNKQEVTSLTHSSSVNSDSETNGDKGKGFSHIAPMAAPDHESDSQLC